MSLRGLEVPNSPDPVNRLILLGASNLTLSLRKVIHLMQDQCGRPSDVLVVAGHGRSYGQYSQVLGRGLPGIVSSTMWSYLESVKPLPTHALLTDIGNDIPYGYLPEQILEWVDWCVEQLRRQTCQIVMTNIPITSIEALTELHFKIIRSIFFPFSRLRRVEIIDRAREVHRGLITMASGRNFDLFEQEPIWFGPDAIHILYWKRRDLYRRILQRFTNTGIKGNSAEGTDPGLSAWSQSPCFACQKIFGRERVCPQPSGYLVDGTAVSMY